MPTNILSIQPRKADFRTQANADWLDGLAIWQAGAGGVVAGASNAGNGSLVISSVAPQALLGHHVVSVTSVDGLPRITVQSPQGTVTGQGVVGLPIFAGGITFTLGAGSLAFAVDDTFAISVLPVPVDITGLTFTMHVRLSSNSANVILSASSAPASGGVPTIAAGTTGGQIAMRVLRAAMARDVFPPNTYVYDILATDPDAGLTVPTFFGTIEHVDGVTLLP